MKIALVGKYGEGDAVAGPERVARELFAELKKSNSDTIFIEYFFKGYADFSFFKKYFGKKKDGNVLKLGVIPIIIMLFKEKFNIVHLVNSQRFQVIILLLKPVLKFKIVSTLHGFMRYELAGRTNLWKEKHFIDLWIEKKIIKSSDLIIFPSKLLADVFAIEYKSFQKKFKVIPNGVSKQFLNVETPQRSFTNDISLIFYNAFNQSIKKGLKELVEQLSLVQNIKIKLFVCGYKEQVENKNQDLEIIFTGLLDHGSFINFCKDKQFIVKSGAFEPFSIIVAECMALGIIPIITENVGIKDYIGHGVNGFKYEYKLSEDLANLIKDIYLKKYNLIEISENAKKIINELNWKNISHKYLDSYKPVL